MLQQSQKFNPNYAAQVVELKESHKHPNADKLIGWTVQGVNTYTSLDYKPSDICIYFPIGCKLNPELISFIGLFRKPEMNLNKEAKGFFEHTCRVRAVKLRQIPSEGFLLRMDLFEDFIQHKLGHKLSYKVGEVFDSVKSFQVCEKYIIKEHSANPKSNNQPRSKKITDDIVENQFNFHYDTAKLAMNEEMLELGDICVITNKFHGSSFVSSKLMVKIPFWTKVYNLIFNKPLFKYDYIYSSRKVIKGVGESDKKGDSYYDVNIWKSVHNLIKPFLSDGMSVYGEVVGYLPNSTKMVQKDYDYGCKPGEFKYFVYRITHTNSQGEVFEWDWASIKNWCDKYNIKHVPELYYGPVNFTLAQLKEKYLEVKCNMCKNDVWAEGICLRNESKNKKAYKLKSFKFLGYEDKVLDSGEEDIESQES